jgi:hypothetical protein
MAESVDEKTKFSQTLNQRLKEGRPWLVKHLEENKLLYLYASVIYAMEDATSYGFGNLKLAFSLKDSFNEQSDAFAANEFHDFECTPEGLAISISTTLALVLLGIFGTYYADDNNLDKNPFKLFAVKVYPYIRDILQAIKWAYKGMRSTLGMIFYFAKNKEMALHLLFPIGISIAALAMVNRIFLRWMRNTRKQMQDAHRALCQKAYERSCGINIKKELPTEQIDLAKYENSLIYLLNEPKDETSKKTEPKLYYIYKNRDEGYVSEEIHIISEDITNFNDYISLYQNENLSKKLVLDFQLQYKNTQIDKLLFLDALPSDCQLIPKSLIFLTDPNLDDDKRLYYIDEQCNIILHPYSLTFSEKYAFGKNNKHSINLLPWQIDTILQKHTTNYKQRNIGISHDDWETFCQDMKAQETSLGFAIYGYVGSVISAIFDGLYFYIGVTFISALNPAAFIAVLSMASVMFFLCLVARVYEEYDYKRILARTQIEVGIAKHRAECQILRVEIEKKLIVNPEDESIAQDLESLQTALKNYSGAQKELHENVHITLLSAVLQGIKNGLSTQGIISTIMLLVATILMFNSIPCPPIFIITMMAISLAVLAATVVQYLLSYREYLNNRKEFVDIKFDDPTQNDSNEERFVSLLSKKHQADDYSCYEPPDLHVMAWMELLRQPINSYGKSQKNFNELNYHSGEYHEPWYIFLVNMVFVLLIAIAFAIRTVKKMFTEPRDNTIIIKNDALETEHTIPKVSTNGFFGNKGEANAEGLEPKILSQKTS